MSGTTGKYLLDLLKILLGALVVFLSISMVQEWDVFKPWMMNRARAQGPPPAVDLVQRKEAEATVGRFLSLAGHYYASGGDSRFSDRMLAAPWVIEELRRDVEYLGRNGRIQEQRLMRIDFESVEPGSARALIVRTKEYWIIRTIFANGRNESDPPRSELLRCRYSLAKEGSTWTLQAWSIDDQTVATPAAAPDAAAAQGLDAPPSPQAGGSTR